MVLYKHKISLKAMEKYIFTISSSISFICHVSNEEYNISIMSIKLLLSENPSVFQLQEQLIDIWSRRNVTEEYQNTLLQAFDRMDNHQCIVEMRKQIQANKSNVSSFQKLQHIQTKRTMIVGALKDVCDIVMESQQLDKSTDLLLQLRKINTRLIEQLFALQESIGKLVTPPQQVKSIFNGFLRATLEKLEDEQQFIVNSDLNNVIEFSDKFDPFYLHQYQQKNKHPNKELTQWAEKISEIGIPEAYKLIKYKKRLMESLQNPQKQRKRFILKSPKQPKAQKKMSEQKQLNLPAIQPKLSDRIKIKQSLPEKSKFTFSLNKHQSERRQQIGIVDSDSKQSAQTKKLFYIKGKSQPRMHDSGINTKGKDQRIQPPKRLKSQIYRLSSPDHGNDRKPSPKTPQRKYGSKEFNQNRLNSWMEPSNMILSQSSEQNEPIRFIHQKAKRKQFKQKSSISKYSKSPNNWSAGPVSNSDEMHNDKVEVKGEESSFEESQQQRDDIPDHMVEIDLSCEPNIKGICRTQKLKKFNIQVRQKRNNRKPEVKQNEGQNQTVDLKGRHKSSYLSEKKMTEPIGYSVNNKQPHQTKKISLIGRKQDENHEAFDQNQPYQQNVHYSDTKPQNTRHSHYRPIERQRLLSHQKHLKNSEQKLETISQLKSNQNSSASNHGIKSITRKELKEDRNLNYSEKQKAVEQTSHRFQHQQKGPLINQQEQSFSNHRYGNIQECKRQPIQNQGSASDRDSSGNHRYGNIQECKRQPIQNQGSASDREKIHHKKQSVSSRKIGISDDLVNSNRSQRKSGQLQEIEQKEKNKGETRKKFNTQDIDNEPNKQRDNKDKSQKESNCEPTAQILIRKKDQKKKELNYKIQTKNSHTYQAQINKPSQNTDRQFGQNKVSEPAKVQLQNIDENQQIKNQTHKSPKQTKTSKQDKHSIMEFLQPKNQFIKKEFGIIHSKQSNNQKNLPQSQRFKEQPINEGGKVIKRVGIRHQTKDEKKDKDSFMLLRQNNEMQQDKTKKQMQSAIKGSKAQRQTFMMKEQKELGMNQDNQTSMDNRIETSSKAEQSEKNEKSMIKKIQSNQTQKEEAFIDNSNEKKDERNGHQRQGVNSKPQNQQIEQLQNEGQQVIKEQISQVHNQTDIHRQEEDQDQSKNAQHINSEGEFKANTVKNQDRAEDRSMSKNRSKKSQPIINSSNKKQEQHKERINYENVKLQSNQAKGGGSKEAKNQEAAWQTNQSEQKKIQKNKQYEKQQEKKLRQKTQKLKENVKYDGAKQQQKKEPQNNQQILKEAPQQQKTQPIHHACHHKQNQINTTQNVQTDKANQQGQNHQNALLKPQKKASKPKIEIKMIPSRQSRVSQILPFLQSQKPKPEYYDTFITSRNFEEKLSNSNCYMTQFHINQQLSLIAICEALNNDDYNIVAWLPINKVQKTELYGQLLNLYCGYLQKYTYLKNIYIRINMKSSQEVSQCLQKGKFQEIKRQENQILFRKSHPKPKDKQFNEFLEAQISFILFEQFQKDHNVFYSQEIDIFSQQNAYLDPSMIQLSKNVSESQQLIQNIENLQSVNQILADKQFDDYTAENDNLITNISLILFLDRQNFNKNGFFTEKGFLCSKFLTSIGPNNSIICRVDTEHKNHATFLVKNVDNIQEAKNSLEEVLKKSNAWKKQYCAVRQFSKSLYGRIFYERTNNDFACYGNWNINLVWKDKLQGKIHHKIDKITKFGPQKFFWLIFTHNSLSYSFQVTSDDFID